MLRCTGQSVALAIEAQQRRSPRHSAGIYVVRMVLHVARPFAIGVEEQHPVMASHVEPVRGHRLAIAYPLQKAVPHDRVLMLPNNYVSRGPAAGLAAGS